MPNPITGLSATGYQNPWGLYNPAYTDMETKMSSGANPAIDFSLGMGMNSSIFGNNALGYGSTPYGMGYDSFSYGANPYGMGYDSFGYGAGMGMYGFSPYMAQAMVQSQITALDGQRIIDGKRRDMNYSGQVADMQYGTRLKDAKDTNHEDSVRRETNFKKACERLNERLEAKDTEAAMREYNYALSLMATVYDDVDEKRSPETPSLRTDIKSAFERKYEEICGINFKDKIDQCLPGEFGSGFQSMWRMQDIMSKEEMKALVDDRNMAFKEEASTYRDIGSITGGVANTLAYGAGGAVAGGAAGVVGGGTIGLIGDMYKKATAASGSTTTSTVSYCKKFAKVGGKGVAFIAGLAALVYGACKNITKD